VSIGKVFLQIFASPIRWIITIPKVLVKARQRARSIDHKKGRVLTGPCLFPGWKINIFRKFNER
jgi:hypothetical protein